MSVREGFRRFEILYWRRWWLLLIAPAAMFTYRTLEQDPPLGIEPALWLIAKLVLFGALAALLLALLTWLGAGFFAQPAEWERRLQPAQKAANQAELNRD